MLSKQEKFELIRQAEKHNLTNDQLESLQKWALETTINDCLLDLLFSGFIDIVDIRDNNPSFVVTEKGMNFQDYEYELEDFIEDGCDNFNPDDLELEDEENFDHIAELEEDDQLMQQIERIPDKEKAITMLSQLLSDIKKRT